MDDDSGEPREPVEAVDPVDPSAQAKAAMDRARTGARARGSVQKSARTAARERGTRSATPATDPAPYGAGREPHAVGGEITSMFSRLGWTEQVEVASVVARWSEVVGPEIADHCEVISFEDGALTVRASSTAWADQLRIISGQIRQRLNEQVGRDVVAKVTVEGPSTRSWTRGPRTVKGRGPRDTYG